MSTAHRAWAVGGGLLAVAIAAATACSAQAHPASPVAEAAATASAVPAAAPSSPAPAPPARVAGSPEAAPAAMPALQAARTTADLAALARRLPAGVRLTAPATWASWTGGRPGYAEDVDGCPHLAGRLGAALGGTWSYWQGTLPSGPYGCYWTTEPLTASPLPQDRVVVSVGYQHGTLPGVLAGEDYCAGGVEAPREAVPAVGTGALLMGCDDAAGRGFDLAVPDTGGTGVFFLHSAGGTAVTGAQTSAALLAVLSATRHAYS